MRPQAFLSSLLGTLVLGTLAGAQGQALILEGDVIPGVGVVTRVLHVSVADGGQWIAHVLTNHPVPQADEVLLKNGSLYLREGDPTAGGAARVVLLDLEGTPAMSINAHGQVAWGDYEHLFFDGQLVLSEGDPVSAPGVAPGTVYLDFPRVVLNDSGVLLASVRIDDPSLPSPNGEVALVRIQLSPAGIPVTEEILVKSGETPLGTAIDMQSDVSRSFALNESGDAIAQVHNTTYCCIVAGILLNDTVIASTGAPSTVFGKDWSQIHANVDLGDGGDLAYSGFVPGIGEILVWNGVKVIAAGESLPAFAPFVLEDLAEGITGSLPVQSAFVDAAGHLLWYANWSDPDTSRDSGLLLDHELILQEGVSIAAGQIITRIGDFDEPDYDYELSDDGRFLIFEATLADGREGAFLLDLEAGAFPYSGCTPNPGALAVTTDVAIGIDVPTIGEDLHFQMTNPQPTSGPISAYVGFASQPAPTFPPCGSAVPGLGELLIDAPFHVLELTTSSIPVIAFGTVEVPLNPALVGEEIYLQGLFLAPGAAEQGRLTDGVEVRFGF